jgi:peptide/nickel transport system permease protein
VVELLLPALALATPLVALFLAQVREAVGGALAQDFVRAARSRGLSETSVIFRHAMRPALNPLITIFGYSLGSVMSGSVIVETVLNWPGIGWLSVIAVRSRDVPLLMGIVLASGAAVFLANLTADILLCLNDPRLREKGGAL